MWEIILFYFTSFYIFTYDREHLYQVLWPGTGPGHDRDPMPCSTRSLYQVDRVHTFQGVDRDKSLFRVYYFKLMLFTSSYRLGLPVYGLLMTLYGNVQRLWVTWSWWPGVKHHYYFFLFFLLLLCNLCLGCRREKSYYYILLFLLWLVTV